MVYTGVLIDRFNIFVRDTHGIVTKKDKFVSWLMIVLAVTSSTVAISSEIGRLFSNHDGAVS